MRASVNLLRALPRPSLRLSAQSYRPLRPLRFAAPHANIRTFAIMADAVAASAPAATPAVHPTASTSNAAPPNSQVADKAKSKKEKKGPPGGLSQLEVSQSAVEMSARELTWPGSQLAPPPEFFATRNAIFDKYKKEYDDWVASGWTSAWVIQGTAV